MIDKIVHRRNMLNARKLLACMFGYGLFFGSTYWLFDRGIISLHAAILAIMEVTLTLLLLTWFLIFNPFRRK